VLDELLRASCIRVGRDQGQVNGAPVLAGSIEVYKILLSLTIRDTLSPFVRTSSLCFELPRTLGWLR